MHDIPASLAKWAVQRTDRTWLAQRSGPDRRWRKLSYRRRPSIPFVDLAATGMPKAVINTQQMVCANVAMPARCGAPRQAREGFTSTGCRGTTRWAAARRSTAC